MDATLQNLHLEVAYKVGRASSCRDKVRYSNEERAEKFVEKLSAKHNKIMEAYPCPYCKGWHIGRKMSMEELFEHLKEDQ